MKTSPRQRSRKLIALLLTLAILAMVLLASSAITPSYAAEPMALDDNVPDIFPSYDDNDDNSLRLSDLFDDGGAE